MVTFRTKARAIDHLGKGQIADLPTAITELWKNGYDAYADNVRCELYPESVKGLEQSVFILSDDGFGMGRKDILEKWVVLGTDSKARGEMSLSIEDRLGKSYRIPLGEKGIGRLSVAYLGTPMLLITKKKGKFAQVLLADWRILENFNLYLEDIDFPIETLHTKFDAKPEYDKMLRKLKHQFRGNFEENDWTEHKDLEYEMKRDLGKLKIPAVIFTEEIEPFFDLEHHGTTFIIFNPHPQLSELGIGGAVWDSEASSGVNYLRSSLNGITNLFRNENEIDVNATFILHDDSGVYDIIAQSDFFSREDIFAADHWLSGKFNEFGEFHGELNVFNHVHKVFFRANRPPGKTPYGPFPIEFGFMEGLPINSKLKREQWDKYEKKLNAYGGLYIYRDGFRVLPYGRAEYDFLMFEERRSRSATYYQFSHRRLFGYIGLSREFNPSLKDKAGREGFIVNKAYREFVDDLIDFFTDLSIRYFRTVKIGEPTSRQAQVEEIKARNERILDAEKKKSKTTTRKFSKDLKDNLLKVELLETETNKLYSRVKNESFNEKIRFNVIQNLIDEVRENQIRLKELNLIKPQRITLSKSLKAKYSDYRQKIGQVKEAIDACNDLIGNLQAYLTEEEFEDEFKKRVESYVRSLKNKLSSYKKRLSNAMNPILEEIGSDMSSVPGELSFDTSAVSQDVNSADPDDHQDILRNLDLMFDQYAESIDEKYGPLTNHVEGLDLSIDDDALVGWYKEQYQQISEKIEAMHELAQLGMAIEIIDHQFNVLYAEIAQALTYFRKFIVNNEDDQEHFNQLRNAFQHLETNHKLLTPLYRTTRRSRIEISGVEIKKYLTDFFSGRFEKHRITFTTNSAFDNYTFFTFESVLKPVFINIVNNGIYWLRSVNDRKIKILYEDGVFLILNSGKKIGCEFLEDIFKLFFSRRPGGRGIGLYLAQTNLRTVGFDIYATEDRKFNKMNGACFVIVPPKEFDDEL